MDSEPNPQVMHLLAVLRSVIRNSDLSAREIERRLEMSGGYISRLLSGRIEVKLSHIFEIAEVLRMYPGELFAVAFPLQGRDPSPMMNRLIELTPALGTLFQPPPAGPRPPAETKEMEDRILEALRPFLRELVGKS